MSPRATEPAADIGNLLRQRARFLAFLRPRTRDEATAEDVLQSAYVKALASRTALRDTSSIVKWFFQILRRSAVDQHRRFTASERATHAVGALARRADDDAGLMTAVCACVEGLLQTLPSDQREILRRVDLEEASPADAAASLGITPGNASVRLHRARKVLRAKLEAVCGACTEHRCLDCRCKPARK